MANSKIKYLMKKRGQIELAILLAIGLIVVIGGTIYVGSSIAGSVSGSEARIIQGYDGGYVVDLNTNLIYNPKKCVVKLENYIFFSSLEQAHSFGYSDAPNCV